MKPEVKAAVGAASVVSACVESVVVSVGYDLAAEGGVKAMLDEFDQEVGLHYLKAIHLNDSKGDSHDSHAQISHTQISYMIYSLSCTNFVTFMNSLSFLSFLQVN